MYAYNARFKGGLDPPLLQQDPVDLSEERMDFDGFLQPLGHHTAQTLTGVLCHELRKREYISYYIIYIEGYILIYEQCVRSCKQFLWNTTNTIQGRYH